MRKIFLHLLPFALVNSVAWGACHVITPSGSGDKSGSDWSNACAGFSGNCSTTSGMVRGDSYYVGEGTYSAPTLSRANSGSSVITIKAPTSGDHCTNTGFNQSTHVGQAQLTGKMLVQSDYWVVDGQYGTDTPGSGKGTYGLKVRWNGGNQAMQIECSGGCSNSTFRFLEIQGSNGADAGCDLGVRVLGYNQNPNTHDVLLDNLYIYGSNNNVGFQVADNVTLQNSILAENWSTSSCHGENIALNGPSDVTIRNNRFINCAGTACIATPSSLSMAINNMNIYGNVFYDDLTRTGSCPSNFTCVGNGIIAIIDKVNVSGLKIYNNTVANWISGHMAGGSSLTFFSNSSGGTISGMDLRNNLFYNNVPIQVGNSGTCQSNSFFSTTRSSSACSGDAMESGNPFVNSKLDFRLTADTTAWSALSAPYNVDGEGTTRTSSRGAYQFSGAAALPAPPTNLTSSVL